MSRQNGYTITIKAFVESPKNDFERQAAAAVMMATITKSKTIPAEFLALASIEDVSAKYGSRSLSVPAPETESTGDEPGGQTQTDGESETQATGAPTGRKRTAG